MTPVIFFLVFCALFSVTVSYNILVVSTTPFYSNYKFASKMVRHLIKRGHEVTFVSPYPERIRLDKVKEVSLLYMMADVHGDPEYEIEPGLPEVRDVCMKEIELYACGSFLVPMALDNSNMTDFLKSEQHFDAVIVEHFANDAILGLAYHFNAPLIALSLLPPSHVNSYLLMNPETPSYIPNLFRPFSKTMDFLDRFRNLYAYLTDQHILGVHLAYQSRFFNHYLSKGASLDQVLQNVSLLLTNSHWSISNPVPLHPNTIEIAGFHLDRPRKVSNNLDRFMNGATHGVVVFCMGSYVKYERVLGRYVNILRESFSKIQQRVVWRYDGVVYDIPDNVFVVHLRLDQQDVLAHPNVKLFITHGGLMAVIEAVSNGIPLLGIPVYADQESNIQKAVEDGYAVKVKMTNITVESMDAALNEVLNNPKYKEVAMQKSYLLKNQPVQPVDNAMFWIEHVIRHGGGSHFRSPAHDYNWYQLNMVDVVMFIVLLPIGAYVVLMLLALHFLKITVMRAYRQFRGIPEEVPRENVRVPVVRPRPRPEESPTHYSRVEPPPRRETPRTGGTQTQQRRRRRNRGRF